ncbi:unnamed protein product [Durusdinium trenchii]|uniref:Uncharacterized protein n=1 Tax=Durusdinium trenchii TaxID=1381693 RepID=A0ABP0H4R1_9DINO
METGNRVSDAFTALQKEDANLRRVSKEVEDARKREEQEKLDSLAMQHFLPDIKSIVNEAEDEVEKALITHEMIANAEEDSKLHAVEMTEAACARAQQALDGVRASLKAKRSELPQLDSSAPRGELELQRLEKHLQAAQLKLKPLKAARNEWNMQRRSKKMIEEVEEKIILAEVELDRLDALLKTEGPLNEVLFAEMHAALKSSADAQEVMASHVNAPKVQNCPWARRKIELLEPRVEDAQSRHITAEGALQNLEDRFATDAMFEEAKGKFQVINDGLRQMQDLLREADSAEDILLVVKAGEEQKVKLQQALSGTKVFVSTKAVTVKRHLADGFLA